MNVANMVSDQAILLKFRDFLVDVDSNKIENLSRVFPEWRGKPYRLEVDKIKQEFKAEGQEFERLENDCDVWREFNSKECDGKTLRYILKSCAKTVNLFVDDNVLNLINKQKLLQMFFVVFDVVPKCLVDSVKLSENVGINGLANKVDLSKLSPKILPEGLPKDKIVIQYDKLKEKLLIPVGLPDITNSDSLLQAMINFPKGKLIFDFIVELCAENSINIDEKRLRGQERNVCISLFFQIFEVEFPSEATSSKITPAPEVETPINDDISHPIYIDFCDMQEIYAAGNKISCPEWDINNRIIVYNGMPIIAADEFWVKNPVDKPLYYGVAALVSAETKIVAAVGKLENWRDKDGGKHPHLVFDSVNIRFDAFNDSRNFLAVLFPANVKGFFANYTSSNESEIYNGDIYEIPVNIESKDPELTSRTLCIDFGTSNTTAGTYGLDKNDTSDKINLVKFANATTAETTTHTMLPTVVLVDSVDGEKPIFKFGYDAKNEIEAADYTTSATVFYEIKRFVNTLDKTEILYDKNGKKFHREVTHREIIESYLRHVISSAEHQFKVKFQKLHFTAPVKIKGSFMNAMREILSDDKAKDATDCKTYYKIEEKCIDEALAIVYHFIAHRPESKTDGDIMILDCGGGTTDLASCHYTLTDGKLGKVLTVDTGFESGEANFGGNNITYRILQMLKIKIAAHLESGINRTMESLIPEDESKILSAIDEPLYVKDSGQLMGKNNIVEGLYAKFTEEYQKAEKIIPTRFEDYPGRNEGPMVKRNYYFLWQMAEAVKIEFYKSNRVQVDFTRQDHRKIATSDMEKYYLYARSEDGSLNKISKPMEKVEITVKEINRIICPDIYNLLNTLLERFVGSDLGEGMKNLQKFWYRLSGQSCKISLFHDLLKEFIPGKLIRREDNNAPDRYVSTDSGILKELCIRGSIEYIRDKAKGEVKPVINVKPPQMIYNVYLAKNGKPSDICLLQANGGIKLISRSADMREVDFIVTDSNNVVKNKVLYVFPTDVLGTDNFNSLKNYILKTTSLDENALKEKIFDVIRDISPIGDNNGDAVRCVFVLPANEGYGFQIHQVRIDETGKGKKEYRASYRYANYEDEALQTFFYGDR